LYNANSQMSKRSALDIFAELKNEADMNPEEWSSKKTKVEFTPPQLKLLNEGGVTPEEIQHALNLGVNSSFSTGLFEEAKHTKMEMNAISKRELSPGARPYFPVTGV